MKKLIGSKGRILAGIAILFTILIISSNCSKSSTSVTPGTNEVFIQNMAFNPITITVAVNTTITWTNKDAVAHTVTSDTTGIFNSGTLSTNATWSHQFTTAGSFPYHCTVHPSMKATVVVN